MDPTLHSILVVDDIQASRYALVKTLQQLGYHTAEAEGGRQALLVAQYVSAIVLDVHLPDLHGFDVCRQLRDHPKTSRTPIIHVSAVHLDEADRGEGLRAGANAYLFSPVQQNELAETLRTLLGN
jgi:CheY-like chemotaxis protein